MPPCWKSIPFDTLKCDGVSLFTNTGDKWWGDPMFLPMFDELNRRNAAVFFHPTVANCCHNLAGPWRWCRGVRL